MNMQGLPLTYWLYCKDIRYATRVNYRSEQYFAKKTVKIIFQRQSQVYVFIP